MKTPNRRGWRSFSAFASVSWHQLRTNHCSYHKNSEKSTNATVTLFCLFIFGSFLQFLLINCLHLLDKRTRFFLSSPLFGSCILFLLDSFVWLLTFRVFLLDLCAFYVKQSEQESQTLLCDNFESLKKLYKNLRLLSLDAINVPPFFRAHKI